MSLDSFEMAMQGILAGLIIAFIATYVARRFALHRQSQQAKRLIAELAALEAALMRDEPPNDIRERAELIASLQRLETRVTACSKRLLGWRRSSEVERWIVSPQLEPLVVDYERAGAMTTRLLALATRRGARAQA